MPRVLIADDNDDVREGLRGIFSHVDDWRVCGQAANGLEAVQLAGKLKTDVVLLDFQMPVMNGLEAAREISKNDPSVPIAMYTLHQNTRRSPPVWRTICLVYAVHLDGISSRWIDRMGASQSDFCTQRRARLARRFRRVLFGE